MNPHALRSEFLLRPDVTFLNHGSFGACPKPVFAVYQHWQRLFEAEPVEYFGRRYDALIDQARATLAAYLQGEPDNLIFVPNATTGVNLVARSLKLSPGDEILMTDQEYGAMAYTWAFVSQRSGARVVTHPLDVRDTTPGAFADAFWASVTPRTRVIFLSHITSATATILPVADLCRRARAAGILTVIDGAHAPGQLRLDLRALDADFYTGNCHKWLCAPKGAAFLYARRELHDLLEPAVISWGWLPGASFARRHGWQGTRDFAAFLAIPAAIDFQRAHDWNAVREYGHSLARHTRAQLAEVFGIPPLVPDSVDWFAQMVTAPLPACDGEALGRRLREEYRIEVPITTWNDRMGVRASFQGYNTLDDAERLIGALRAVFAAQA